MPKKPTGSAKPAKKERKETRFVKLRGTAIAVFIKKPNDYGAFTVRLKLDPESFKIFNEAGIQTKINEQGEVTLRRKAAALIKDSLVEFGPPPVFNSDAELIEKPPIIGEGSDIEVKVCVYDTIKGVGHRVEAIMIHNLVDWVPKDEDGNPKPRNDDPWW